MFLRLTVDTLIAGMLVTILAGVMLLHRANQHMVSKHRSVHQSLAQLHEAALYHGAMDLASNRSVSGFPINISPVWFKLDGLPTNPMAPGRHPWMDIAPAHDMHDHPPDPIITDDRQAGLWYNPNRGIFRARVLPQESPQATVELYNQLNGTQLSRLDGAPNLARAPQPHPLDAAPYRGDDWRQTFASFDLPVDHETDESTGSQALEVHLP